MIVLFFIISTMLPSKIVSSLEDANKVQVIKELIDERKENKKVFLNSDGTYTVRLYNEAIHYLKEGKYEEIKNSLEAKDEAYKNIANNIQLDINKNPLADKAVTVTKDNYQISMTAKGNLNSNAQLSPSFKEIKTKEFDSLKKEGNVQLSSVSPNKNEIRAIEYSNIYDTENNIKIQYVPRSNGLKENIILNCYKGQNTFEFEVKLDNSYPEVLEDGRVALKDKENGKVIGFVTRPYMFDSSKEDHYSDEVKYEVEKIKDKEDYYKFKVIADNEFLKSSNTVYPVTIDPTVEYVEEVTNNVWPNVGVCVKSEYPNSSFLGNEYLRVGIWTGPNPSGRMYSYMKFNNFPQQGIVKSAKLWDFCDTNAAFEIPVGIHKVTSDWDPAYIKWANRPYYDDNLEARTDVGSYGWYSWDVTSLVQQWISGESDNYGLVMKQISDQTYTYRRFNSPDNCINNPYIEFTYVDKPQSPSNVRLTGNKNGLNSSTGYINASWNEVPGADGYVVNLFNGRYYEQVKDVGKNLSWSSKDQKIWPTYSEIEMGRYQLHTNDSLGGELPDDPLPTYLKAKENTDEESKYWVRIKAYKKVEDGDKEYRFISDLYPSGDNNMNMQNIVMPDCTPPANVQQPKFSFERNITNNSWSLKANWNEPKDYPKGMAVGIGSYKADLYSGDIKVDSKIINSTNVSFDVNKDLADFHVEVFAYDKNGNYNVKGTKSNIIKTGDKTGPSMPTEFSITPNGWTNSKNPIIKWKGIKDISGIEKIEYRVDGGTWTNTGRFKEDDSAELNLDNLQNGTHYIEVRGIDRNKNIGTVSNKVEYKKDTKLPKINFNSPYNLQSFNGTVNIKANIEEEHLKKWTLEYGIGKNPANFIKISEKENIKDGSVDYMWNVSSFLDGFYVIRLSAEDEAGNKSQSNITILRSNYISYLPLLQIDYPKNNQVITSLTSQVVNYQRINNGGKRGLLGKLFINNKMEYEELKEGDELRFNPIRYKEGEINSIYVQAKSERGEELYSTVQYKNFSKYIMDFDVLSYLDSKDDKSKLLSYLNGKFEIKKQDEEPVITNRNNITIGNGYVRLFFIDENGVVKDKDYEFRPNIEPIVPRYICDFSANFRTPQSTPLYQQPGFFEYKKDMDYDIQEVKLTAKEDKPKGTDIKYEISTDNGLSWQSINLNEKVVLKKSGRNLRLKVNLYTSNEYETPSVSGWELIDSKAEEIYENQNDSNNTFIVKLVQEPENLTVYPQVNYKTLLRWNYKYDSVLKNLENPITFNIYRSEDPKFAPSKENLIATGIKETSWGDYNLNYGKKFYYKITAVNKNIRNLDNSPRESVPSNSADGVIIDKNEIEKRLGIQDYWGFSQFDTAVGEGYINISTGNLCYQASDFEYAGRRLATVMRRSYNSQSTAKTSLGFGWDFSFNTVLLKEYDEKGNEVGMLLKDGDGTIHRFTKNKDNSYNSPKGTYIKLGLDGKEGTYKIKRKDNIEYNFDKNLKLKSFTEPNGNSINVEYDIRGNISKVTDSVGNITELKYDLRDRLTEVKDPSKLTTYYVYESYESDSLRESYVMDENRVKYSEEYEYDGDNNLKGIKDPNACYDGSPENTTGISYSNDKVIKITDAIGEFFTLNYEKGSTQIIDDKNKWIRISYNVDGSIINKMDMKNNSKCYEYDDNLNITRAYFYNEIEGQKKLIQYLYTYDDKGNLLTETDPLNNKITYSNYNEFGKVGKVSIPVDKDKIAENIYEYDDKGNLVKEIDPEKRVSTYNYDENGNRISIIDCFGNEKTYVYDKTKKDKLIKIIEPLGKYTLLEYDEDTGNLIKTTDNLGNKVESSYNLLGRITETRYFDKNKPGEVYAKTKNYYDLNGNLKSTIDKKGNEIKKSFDKIGRLRAITTQAGKTSYVDYKYDANKNLIIENKDAEGRIIRKYHDDLGRVIKEEAAYGNESIKPVTYQYDSLGNVISTTNADGEETKYYYNELDQVFKTVFGTKDLEITNKVEYDSLGRKIKTIDGENNEIRYDYDLIGRLTKVTSGLNSNLPQTTKYQYDIRTQVNNQVAVANKVIDALNRESITYFDSLGRKIKEENLGDISTSDKKEVLYEYYGGGGNLRKVTKPGKENTVEYMYDGQNRINKVLYKKENTTGEEYFIEYAYDKNDNRTTMRDVVRKTNMDIRSDTVREINYRYDSTNKLTEVVQDGVVVSYEYDGSGNRISTSYTGDSNGALTAEKNIRYNYDKFNRLDSIGIKYKTGEKNSYYKVRQYEYKNSGKINSVYDYRQFESGGNAVTKTEYNYNSMGMPETLIYKDSTDGKNYVQKEKYTVNYDKRGYILNEECITNYDNKELKVNKSYKYDDIGKLLNSTNKSSELENTVSYIYDAVGNRREMHTESKGKENKKESLYYEYNEFNRLLSIKKKQEDTMEIVSRYKYDEAGNRIEEINKKKLNSEKFEENKSYKYDSLDRLTNAEVKTKEEDIEGNKEVTKNIENKYDGDGKRIWQKEDGYETGYFYDGDSILFTTEPNLKKAQENILTPSGNIIASKRVDGDYKDKYLFYNYDLRGSVSSILKPEGGAAKRYEYDEFGNTKEVTNSNIKNDVKFTGATQDKSTNLYHMGARYYDSNTGRFLTQDTFKGSYNSPWTQHLYNYCNNNPINYIDPTGHLPGFYSHLRADGDDAGHEYIPATGRFIDHTKNTGYTPPAPGPEEGPSLLARGISIGVGFIPGVGDAKDFIDAISGEDIITGEKLSWVDRGLSLASAFIPFVNRAALKGTSELAQASMKYYDDIADVARRSGDEIEDAINGVSKTLTPFERGRLFEKNALEQFGWKKNTKKVGNSIPDAIVNGRIKEVKDVKYLTMSKQFREYEKSGMPIDLIVNKNTRISEPLMKLIRKTGGKITRID